MTTPAPNPFEALGLPARPDLDDEQVRAAWRAIAAATHPDRADGGDLARYTAASAAYAELRTPWSPVGGLRRPGRPRHPGGAGSGYLADPGHPRPRGARLRRRRGSRCWRCCGSRSGSRGAGRCTWPSAAIAAAVLSLLVLQLIPGSPAAPADVLGFVLWFVLSGRSDLAPPPER